MSARQYARVALAVAAVVAVVAPAAVAPVTASSPPQALCPICGDHLERVAAYETGVSATATGSDLRMVVDERGDASMRARVTLNDSTAERFRENASAMDAVVSAAFDGGGYAFGVDRAANVSAGMDGDVLVVTYDVPDVAHRARGGVLLVTAFGERTYYVTTNVDRFTMVGPDGYAVANDPRTGAVEARGATDAASGDGEVVTWNPADGELGADERLDRGTYVAFAPDDGLGARLNAELAVLATVGPLMVGDALLLGGPTAVVLALALLACLFLVGESGRPEREARWLAALGASVVVVAALWRLVEGQDLARSENLPLLAVPAGVAALGYLSMRSPAVASGREALLRAGGTVGVAGAVAAALLPSFLTPFAVVPTVVVGGFYVVGVLDEHVGWPVAAAAALVVATPPLAVLPRTPIGAGLGAGFVGILLTAVVVLLAPVAVLAYRIGASARVTGERVVDRRTTA